jgi:hypothetical protein
MDLDGPGPLRLEQLTLDPPQSGGELGPAGRVHVAPEDLRHVQLSGLMVGPGLVFGTVLVDHVDPVAHGADEVVKRQVLGEPDQVGLDIGERVSDHLPP